MSSLTINSPRWSPPSTLHPAWLQVSQTISQFNLGETPGVLYSSGAARRCPPVRCRYNALAKTLDGPRKYFCTEWRGLQNTAVSPRAGDSRGCWAGQREARVTRDNRDTCRRVHVTRGKVGITVLHCMIVAVSQCYRRAADLKIIIHFTAAEVEQRTVLH